MAESKREHGGEMLRKLDQSRDQIKVGMRVAARYFDPDGPNPVDNMSTEHGYVLRIIGDDPWSYSIRAIIVMLDGHKSMFGWEPPSEMSFFADSLWVEDSE